MTDPRAPDVRRLLEVLHRHGAEYILVGGAAATFLGAARLTYDVDCVPKREPENLDRVAAALRSLGAHLRVAGLTDDEAKQLPLPIDRHSLAQMEISTWRTDAGDIDILVGIPDRSGRLQGYDELASRGAVIDAQGTPIVIVAVDDLIGSKEWANRPKDRDALPELQALRSAIVATEPD